MSTNVVNNGLSGISDNLVEKNGKAYLDGFEVDVVTECENCESEFDSPVIVSTDPDNRTKVLVICGDCTSDESESDENDEDEDGE